MLCRGLRRELRGAGGLEWGEGCLGLAGALVSSNYAPRGAGLAQDPVRTGNTAVA